MHLEWLDAIKFTFGFTSFFIMLLVFDIFYQEREKKAGRLRITVEVEVPWEKRENFKEHAKNFPGTKVI